MCPEVIKAEAAEDLPDRTPGAQVWGIVISAEASLGIRSLLWAAVEVDKGLVCFPRS